MKRFALFLVSSVILLSASPVFAQPGPGPDRGPMWGYGHMWGDGGGWGGGGWGGGWHGIIGPFMMLLAIVAIVVLILWLVRSFSHVGFHRGHGACPQCGYGGPRGGAALDILGERFARGEINKDEFEEKRRLLGR